MEWQPIETAPKDGTNILVFHDKTEEMHVAFWNKTLEDWQNGSFQFLDESFLSKWMPLPPPPETK